MVMSLTEYLNLQIEEALSPTNRWYASEKAGREINDPEYLFRHYVKSGGACNFAKKHSIKRGCELTTDSLSC
jgi:hypothetical protein